MSRLRLLAQKQCVRDFSFSSFALHVVSSGVQVRFHFCGWIDFVREPNRSRARSFARWRSRGTLAKNKHGGNLVSLLRRGATVVSSCPTGAYSTHVPVGHQWMLFLTLVGTTSFLVSVQGMVRGTTCLGMPIFSHSHFFPQW